MTEANLLNRLKRFGYGQHHGPMAKACAEAHAEIQRLRLALSFYADPENYHAIAIMADSPCGEFAEDFNNADDWVAQPYGRPMPGKRARAALLGGPKETPTLARAARYETER